MLHLILAAALNASLQQAISYFQEQRPKLEARLGADQTVDLGLRLVTDENALNDPAPAWYTQQAWNETLQTVSSTDIEAVHKAAEDATPQLPRQTGLHEGFVRSAIDGVWNP